MKNGDRFTGEIKRIQHGMLCIETNYLSDSIAIDWGQVERVQSTAGFRVETDDGTVYVGKIERMPGDDDGGDFFVRGQGTEVKVAADHVATMQPIKEDFWAQWKGFVNFGLNFDGGNSVMQFSFVASADYIATKWTFENDLNPSLNRQSDASTIAYEDFQNKIARHLSRNSYITSLADFLGSDQQDITLRVTLGGGYGHYLIRNRSTSFGWLAGTVFTHERFTPDAGVDPTQSNVEGLLGVNHDFYRFDKVELQTQLLVFPGITDSGRVRATLTTNYSFKFTDHLNLMFSLYDNFDSRAPAGTKKNAVGVNTTLGWTF